MALVRSGNREEFECGTDDEWTKMMDRGGLLYDMSKKQRIHSFLQLKKKQDSA